jgi:predicted DsbA family dithiol-disulfide isomerase
MMPEFYSHRQWSGRFLAGCGVNLDMGVFRSCLDSGKHKLEIQNDQQVATSLQINGTPSFLVGRTTGEEVSGAIIVGAQPFSVFETKVREAATAP